MVRLPTKIRSPQIMMNTTVPGVRCPMRASLIEAMMIETIEQKRKNLSIMFIVKYYYCLKTYPTEYKQHACFSFFLNTNQADRQSERQIIGIDIS